MVIVLGGDGLCPGAAFHRGQVSRSLPGMVGNTYPSPICMFPSEAFDSSTGPPFFLVKHWTQEARGSPWDGSGGSYRPWIGLRRQWNPGTHCQDLTAEREGRAVHREVLTRPPAWGRSFWRNASYEEGGAGRPRQSVTAWPPGESDGGGAQKPEKTLPGPWPWQPPWMKTSPDPSIMGAGDPGGP